MKFILNIVENSKNYHKEIERNGKFIIFIIMTMIFILCFNYIIILKKNVIDF